MKHKCNVEKLVLPLGGLAQAYGVDADALKTQIEKEITAIVMTFAGAGSMVEVLYDEGGSRLDIFQYFAVEPNKERDASHLPLESARRLDTRMDYYDELGLDRYRLTEQELEVLEVSADSQEKMRMTIQETLRSLLRDAMVKAGREDALEEAGLG
ncbi:MAG: hypothetical protein CL920_35705 [Deltaproteobacteria bacterium]|nr:hypothetical protein [Deltaproteobacteria bacterium]MBU54072.1 hypothetical protein [Deltaproteobacteria bacterium]|tara:strand:+ start:10052 stop:10516 length:465 start_codon:yes stop_codon:yes gene_type:complete